MEKSYREAKQQREMLKSMLLSAFHLKVSVENVHPSVGSLYQIVKEISKDKQNPVKRWRQWYFLFEEDSFNRRALEKFTKESRSLQILLLTQLIRFDVNKKCSGKHNRLKLAKQVFSPNTSWWSEIDSSVQNYELKPRSIWEWQSYLSHLKQKRDFRELSQQFRALLSQLDRELSHSEYRHLRNHLIEKVIYRLPLNSGTEDDGCSSSSSQIDEQKFSGAKDYERTVTLLTSSRTKKKRDKGMILRKVRPKFTQEIEEIEALVRADSDPNQGNLIVSSIQDELIPDFFTGSPFWPTSRSETDSFDGIFWSSEQEEIESNNNYENNRMAGQIPIKTMKFWELVFFGLFLTEEFAQLQARSLKQY